MGGKKLIKLFFEHMEDLNKQIVPPAFLQPSDASMTVYGDDEFRIDKIKGAFFLPQLGWMKCPELKSHKGTVAWLGIITDKGVHQVVLGRGNPFKDGIPAVPFAHTRRLMESMLLDGDIDLLH